MKRIYYLGLGLLISASLLSSCSKDDAGPKQSKTEMLAGATEKKWKLVDNNAFGISIGVEDCEKDDVFTFSNNKNFAYSFGTDDCDGDTNFTGTWSFNAGETTVTIPEDGVDVTYTIKELTSTTLKVEYSFMGVTGGRTYKAL